MWLLPLTAIYSKLGTRDKIFTCSHTLDMLVNRFKELHEQNEELSEKVEKLESENFSQKKDLNDKTAATQYL